MSRSKSPPIPSPPEVFRDPFVGRSQTSLFESGEALRTGGFLNPNDPTVGFLNPLVAINPEITQQAVGLATRDVERLRDQAQKSIIAQLEANNQLESSVTANRLSELNEEFSRDIADIATTFRLADVERSLSNTGNLFELGLNTIGNVGNIGLQNQAQINAAQEANFRNQVAASLAGQGSERGGLGGGILGGLGGGLGGAALGIGLAPFTGGLSLGLTGALAGGGALLGGAGGALAPIGSGASIFAGGAGAAGLAAGGAFTPTSTFSDPTNLNFRLLQSQRATGVA